MGQGVGVLLTGRGGAWLELWVVRVVLREVGRGRELIVRVGRGMVLLVVVMMMVVVRCVVVIVPVGQLRVVDVIFELEPEAGGVRFLLAEVLYEARMTIFLHFDTGEGGGRGGGCWSWGI